MPPPRIAFKSRAQEEQRHAGEVEKKREDEEHKEEQQPVEAEVAPALTQQKQEQQQVEKEKEKEGEVRGETTTIPQQDEAEAAGDRGETMTTMTMRTTTTTTTTNQRQAEEGGGRGGERRKQREYEVFIGGLDRETTERDIVKVFREVGEVVEVRLVRRSFSSKSKGFAFVRFATIQQARRAATELRYVQLRGRSCGVTRSNNHETLHVGNICTSWEKDDLVQKLNEFELENLEEVHLMEDPTNKGKNRGYAFLDFSTHMDALAACCKLQKEEIFLGTDVRADIAFSRSVEPAEEIMSKVRSVFLDGLPPTWDEKCVCLHFEKFGEIENVQLASNMPTAKRKDFGFINFKTREAALDCIEKINESGIYEGDEKVPVKASLKKPLLKRFTQTAGRRGYIRNDYPRSGLRQYEDSRSYFSRTMRTHESVSRQRSLRTQDLSPYSSREAGYSYELSPNRDKYEGQTRRRYVREMHESRRSRGEYYEGSSSKLAIERYRDVEPSYKQLPASYDYPDDGDDEVYYVYETEYSPYESRDFEYYDHPTYAGTKRHYSDIDDDMLVTNSMLRCNRSRSDYELDEYVPREVSKYDRYTRVLPKEHAIYDRVEYTRSSYGTRYLSRDAVRSYR